MRGRFIHIETSYCDTTKFGPILQLVRSGIERIVQDCSVLHYMLFYAIWDRRSHILSERCLILLGKVAYGRDGASKSDFENL